LEEILEIELGMVQQRVLDTGRGHFLFRATPTARRFLLQEGTDFKYGARHLKRAIEKYVVYPLANLLATKQVRFGELLVLDRNEGERCLSLHREGQGAIIPAPPRRVHHAAAVRVVIRAAGEGNEKVTARELKPGMTR
jgi:ATP-dependent Clp protease ATP-binding subunit ClpB